jgi:hypothetical protein
VTVPTMPPPMTMPAMAVPTHFGRVLLRTLLDRRGGGGIGQRQRLRPLSRSGKDQNRTNCSESQNPRHLHRYFSLGSSGAMPAPCGRSHQPLTAAQIASWRERHQLEVIICATDMNARHAIGFRDLHRFRATSKPA